MNQLKYRINFTLLITAEKVAHRKLAAVKFSLLKEVENDLLVSNSEYQK